MVSLKYILIFWSVVLNVSYADDSKFPLESVVVSCELTEHCEDYQERISTLEGGVYSIDELREKIRFILLDTSIERLSFDLFQRGQKYAISISLRQKKKVRNINLNAKEEFDFSSLERLLPYREGSFYQERLDVEAEKLLIKSLSDRGYSDSSVEILRKEDGVNVDLLFKVNLGKVNKIRNIKIQGAEGNRLNQLEKRFSQLKGKNWDGINLKVEADQVAQELFESGHFSVKVDLEVKPLEDVEDAVSALVKVEYGQKLNFHFYGNKLYSQLELGNALKKVIKASSGVFSDEELIGAIKAEYRRRGVYQNKVELSTREGITKDKINFKNYYFNVIEGHKIKISSLEFLGNAQIESDFIKELYYKQATDLASRDYLDEVYLKKFSSLLKTEYLRRGFIYSNISEPSVVFVDDDEANIEFKIQEKQQTILRGIILRNTPPLLSAKIKKALINKEGKAINVVALENDIARLIDMLREDGYFFARISNFEDNRFLRYSSNNSDVQLDFDLDLQKQLVFGDVVVSGYGKTRLEVVHREIGLKKGDIITPKSLEGLKSRLNGLGIFSQVRISPLVTNRSSAADKYLTNIIIRVNEKDFTTYEVAPGFRTDLGAKLSGEVVWKNIDGMNRSASLKAQMNYRFNLNSLDVRRKTENKKLLEGLINASYNEPYLFGAKYDFDTSLAFQRKRFFSFDANIFRVTPKVSKVFSDTFSASLKYQWEFIDQFDATDTRDDGKFRIGGFTPSLTWNRRKLLGGSVNHAIGGHRNELSLEYAAPFFGSEKDDDLEVKYYRLISRNSLYFSITDNFVLAFFYSMGLEKNLANAQKRDAQGRLLFNADGSPNTDGFIPSIKVFRLDGFNTVRGFADSEINRLESETDISQVTITDKAYFANFKFEPRYFLSDNNMLALFFDAGRVYVDHFKPLDLRTSAGLSFKFLTPVGSLDFDYGVKLRRKRLSTGVREGFGRFHLTIGFF